MITIKNAKEIELMREACKVVALVYEELEQKIINNIFNYLKETTVIYITHKNSTNYQARTIYV